MFDWLMHGALAKAANGDLADARLMLARLTILTEGPQVTFAYVDGIRKVAGLLSQRFELSVRDVLMARGLNWAQLDDASEDLIVAAKSAGSRLGSTQDATRIAAQGYSFACLLLHHLYRLRFLSERAPVHQRGAADELADEYALFARSLAESPAGVKEFLRSYDETSAAEVSPKMIAAA